MLTQQRLKEVLSYDPETGDFTWKVSLSPKALVGSIAGYANPFGYIRIQIDGNQFLAHQLAWFYLHGVWRKDLDHKNRKQGDNRIANLRPATPSNQMHNRKMLRNNTSGFKGVAWDEARQKWRALIKVNHKSIYIGRFADRYQAAFEYDKAALRLHGEFATTNFPTRKDLDL